MRQHRQVVAQAGLSLQVAGAPRHRVQRTRDAAQSRVAADEQRVDAAVLEAFDAMRWKGL